MGKREKKSIKAGDKKKSSKFPWERETGWKNVTPGSDCLSLIVGTEEGGFLSLEEFDGDVFDDFDGSGGLVDDGGFEAAKVADVVTKVAKKSKKRKKNKENPVAADVQLIEGSSEAGIHPEGKAVKEKTSRKKRKLKEGKEKTAIKLNTENFVVNQTSDVEDVSSLREGDHDSAGMSTDKKKKAKIGSKARKAKKLLKQNAENGTGADAERSEEGEAMESVELDDTLSGEEEPLESIEMVPEVSLRAKRANKRKKNKAVTTKRTAKEVPDTASVSREEDSDGPIDMSGWAQMRLHPLLEKAIQDLKFREPTPIQRECIPAAAHKGKDVIGAAETGSGKTLAFGLPILQRLLEENEKAAVPDQYDSKAAPKKTRSQSPLRALIVSPTRELALQICEHLKAAAKWTNIEVVPIVGGMATQKQQRLLSYKPEIIVGTPGRLWELMSNGETHLLELQSLSFFVLDEADRMVEKGHFKELQSIIDTLFSGQTKSAEEMENSNMDGVNDSGEGMPTDVPKLRKRRQTLVFSATLALPPNFKNKLKMRNQGPKPFMKSLDSVAGLSERAGVSHKAAIIDLTSSSIVAKNLTECVVECRDEEKDQYLYYFLKIHGGGRTIVFCTSIAALRRVSAILKLLQLPIYPLHAQMQQKQRLKAMDRFKGSQDCVLIATDVAARGLDVPGIRTVIHYQLPHSAEIYVHRSGRTARASSDGCSIALVSPADRAKYVTLCRALSRLDGFNLFPVNASYMPSCKKRVDLAIKVDKLMRKHAQSKAARTWLERSAKEMELDVEESEDEDEPPRKGSSLSKGESSQLKGALKELDEMLNQPLKPRAFSNRYITGAGMTPLVTKQLQEYALAMSNNGAAGKGTKRETTGKSKIVVIGQERMDALDVLRTSASEPTGKRLSKLGKRKQ